MAKLTLEMRDGRTQVLVFESAVLTDYLEQKRDRIHLPGRVEMTLEGVADYEPLIESLATEEKSRPPRHIVECTEASRGELFGKLVFSNGLTAAVILLSVLSTKL